MIPLGLSAADQVRFERGLVSPHHTVRFTVQLLDMDHNVLVNSVGRVLSGQVDVDRGSKAQRRLTMSVLDHDDALNLDASNPNTGGLYQDRMLRVFYGVWSHDFPRWVDVPVFTGPIATLKRSGAVLELSADSKEVLLDTPASLNFTWGKGTPKTNVLVQLADMMGEQWVDIPRRTDKTTAAVSVASKTVVWDWMQQFAEGLNGDDLPAYDGMGVLRLVKRNRDTRWTFRGGDGGTLLQEPAVSYDSSELRNFVVVRGGVPKGGKAAVQAVAHAPASHPLSAQNLGRGGRKRYIREDIEQDTITTAKAAQKLADDTLEKRLALGVQVDFTALVVPHLEPGDVVAVAYGNWVWRMQLDKYTIPLSSDGTMTIGRLGLVRKHTRPKPQPRKAPRRAPMRLKSAAAAKAAAKVAKKTPTSKAKK